jgi:hypothetical protein
VSDSIFPKELAYGNSSDIVYREYINRKNSLTYIFKHDINSLSKDIKDEIKCISQSHPNLLKRYLAKTISIETIIILLDITGIMSSWDLKLKDDIVWKNISKKFHRYKPFINYDQVKFKKILFEYVKSV